MEIVKYIKKNNYSPTLRELSNILKKDKGTIRKTLIRIRDKGYIKIDYYVARGIRLVVGDIYDERIEFCKDDIEKEKDVEYRFSKSDKQSRRSIWS